MPRPSIAFLCSALLVASASGCGTTCNLGGVYKPLIPSPMVSVPFGGVGRDCSWLVEVAPTVAKEPDALWACAFFVVDGPLSLVGDIVMLPIVLMRSRQNGPEPASQEDRSCVSR